MSYRGKYLLLMPAFIHFWHFFVLKYKKGSNNAKIILTTPHGGTEYIRYIKPRIDGCPIGKDCKYEKDEWCASNCKYST